MKNIRSKQSSNKEAFPLWSLLILYEKAHSYKLLSTAYHDMRNLIEWLAPIDTGALAPYPIKKLCKLERSYPLFKLASLLQVNESQLLAYYLDHVPAYNNETADFYII